MSQMLNPRLLDNVDGKKKISDEKVSHLIFECSKHKNTLSKRWTYRYKKNKIEKLIGLGKYPGVSLAEARKIAAKYNVMLADGLDPKSMRDEKKNEQKQLEETVKATAVLDTYTFRKVAHVYHSKRVGQQTNERYKRQYMQQLEKYVFSIVDEEKNMEIGDIPVRELNKQHMIYVMTPIWKPKSEGGIPKTAVDVQQRCSNIYQYAFDYDYHQNSNFWTEGQVERFTGLRKTEIKLKKSQRESMKYLPADKLKQFFDSTKDGIYKVYDHKERKRLKEQYGKEMLPVYSNIKRPFTDLDIQSFDCLLLLIFTAVRTTNAVTAKWSHFNFDEKIWIIPSVQHKNRIEHSVPLAEPVIRFLKRIQKKQKQRTNFASEYVFSKLLRHEAALLTKTYHHIPLSSLRNLLINLGWSAGHVKEDHQRIHVHGFRSTFRTWGSDHKKGFNELALEACIGHAIGNDYQRGTKFEQRREIMNDWADYVNKCL